MINFNDEEALDGLEYYSKSSVVIRSDQSYADSPMAELEKLILDPKRTIIRLLGERAIKDPEDNLKSTFIALAAPSFEGKTQAAFVFREAIPLYFPMIVEAPNTNTLQPIYRNFRSLSESIKRYALMDLDMIAQLSTAGQIPGRFEMISTSEIINFFENKPSYVLGFLVALVEESRRGYFEVPEDQRPDSWMRYHAQRDGFDFEAINIDDLQRSGFDFGDFFLFLDEFEDLEWTLLIRNIARAITLRCMVSNTNTSVASLTGRSNVMYSRINPDHVLSIVVRSLNRTNYNILSSLFPDLGAKIDRIISSTRGAMDKLIVKEILESFKGEMLNDLRPGIAILVVGMIRRYFEENSRSLETFMSDLLVNLKTSICSRKERIATLSGIMGTFGLMMSNAYDESGIPNSPLHVFHRKT